MVVRYIKFDTFTPAAERGLPVTRVISRMALQEILARAVGEDVIMNASNVVNFVDDGNKVMKESSYDEDTTDTAIIGIFWMTFIALLFCLSTFSGNSGAPEWSEI